MTCSGQGWGPELYGIDPDECRRIRESCDRIRAEHERISALIEAVHELRETAESLRDVHEIVEAGDRVAELDNFQLRADIETLMTLVPAWAPRDEPPF